jgi:uncharacterized protein (TIGR02145 family)
MWKELHILYPIPNFFHPSYRRNAMKMASATLRPILKIMVILGIMVQTVLSCSSNDGGSSDDVVPSSSSSGGSIPPSSSGSNKSSSSLCGGRAPSAWEFCHENKFYDLCDSSTYNPVSSGCCTNEQYALSTHFCGGTSYGVLEKCGGSIYTPATQFCDGTTVLDFCEDSTYNPDILGCCNNEKYTLSSHFCGGASYGVLEKCGGSTYAPATQFCLENSVFDKCGGSTYNPATQFCSGSAIYSKCNDSTYTPTTHFCGGGSYGVLEKCSGSEYTPTTQMCHRGSVKSYITDSRDNKKYPYVKIGTQTWLAENLNYNASGSKCYDNQTSYCNTYGILYNWVTAMNIDASYSSKLYTASARHTGICPEGWHIPSDSEWTTLMRNADGTGDYGMSGTADKNLRATSVWNRSGDTDSYGFAALPGGIGYSDGRFVSAGIYGLWWSASENNAYNAFSRFMYSISGNRNSYDKTNLQSVRCLQD